jgi:hypothetical protein
MTCLVFENAKWILLFTIFLGGISIHISQALLSHMFEIDISWGATSKEVEDTTFFEELPRLMNKFKVHFHILLCHDQSYDRGCVRLSGVLENHDIQCDISVGCSSV